MAPSSAAWYSAAISRLAVKIAKRFASSCCLILSSSAFFLAALPGALPSALPSALHSAQNVNQET